MTDAYLRFALLLVNVTSKAIIQRLFCIFSFFRDKKLIQTKKSKDLDLPTGNQTYLIACPAEVNLGNRNTTFRVFDISTIRLFGFVLLFFLMNYCSIHLIQSIGKVSNLSNYSKNSGNGSKQNQKKMSWFIEYTNSLLLLSQRVFTTKYLFIIGFRNRFFFLLFRWFPPNFLIFPLFFFWMISKFDFVYMNAL